MADIEFDTEMARDILAFHAAEWAALPITPVDSPGTDNALFKLGNDAVLRIPKAQSNAGPLEKELTWLPRFDGLPLAVPELLLRATATRPFDFEFGIFRWIDGHIASPDRIDNPDRAALALSKFLMALHEVDTDRAPRAGKLNYDRGIDLIGLTYVVAASITTLADEIDAAQARAIWERACAARPARRPVWVHGDLKADNLIAANGALTGVIDWGLSAVGDPAVDFAAAWTWVDPDSRDLFRNACRLNEDDWRRAEGWALHAAVIALSYYRGRSHEALCQQSRLTLRRLGLLK